MLPKIARRAYETPPATLLYLELRLTTYAYSKVRFSCTFISLLWPIV